ncbi:LuxR C-terminal-related transcriptional regulator [Streptomyces sp. NPDC056534]|uniref:LuxR C-terminal-related transcriptional regulator n=1 Tax=Streptomyces sp. NPDC056534 TaxID=3345857 RepID=UPI0036A376D0
MSAWWPLAGRESELQSFAEAWADRRCRGVVVCGPAGVGKTRLAEECLAQAGRQGVKAGRAAAGVSAGAVPLGAIAHLVPAGVDLSDPAKGFSAVVRALAAPQRSVRAFLVDDLQLLDSTSAVLLQQLSDAGVVRVIGTVRTGELTSEAVKTLVSGDGVHRIDLSVFDQQQTDAVLRAALGGPVRQRTVHTLHAISGGNALYLRELVLGALQSGTLVGDSGVWELTGDGAVGTPKLAELIGSRLQAAPEAARALLELMALAEPVPLADAQGLASSAVLVELEEAGLIRVTNDRRRFSVHLAHPLYGEVLRDQIPARHRSSLLTAHAERVETHGNRRRDDPLRLAAARLAGYVPVAPGLLVQAASLARHAHDYRQVVSLLRAVQPEHHTPATLLLLGEAHAALQEFHEAEACFSRAQDSAVRESDVISSIQARHLNFHLQGRKEESTKVIRRGQEQVVSPTGRRILQVNEGTYRCVTGEPVQGLRLLGAMDDLESGIDDRQVLDAWLFGAVMRAATLSLVGQTSQAEELAAKAYSTHLRNDQKALFHHPLLQRVALVLALEEAGKFTEARSVGLEATDRALSENLPVPYLWNAFATARSELIAGHIQEARDLYDEISSEAHKQSDFFGIRIIDSGFATATALLGDVAAAEAIVTESRQHPVTGFFAGEERLGEAWVHAGRGDLRQARIALLEAALSARTAGHVTSEALLLTDVARLGDAQHVVGRLFQLADVCDGSLAPARAHLAAALAGNEPAPLQTVADELEEFGADLLAAEAASAAAAGWRRAGDTRRATAADRQAETCVSRCPGTRTPLLTEAESTSELTTREWEVANLAASGVASKDIAANLHLSVRTINNHLQHAYAKLGVTSRRELARTLRY